MGNYRSQLVIVRNIGNVIYNSKVTETAAAMYACCRFAEYSCQES